MRYSRQISYPPRFDFSYAYPLIRTVCLTAFHSNSFLLGTTHTVSERELRPAMQLERAKRRKKVQEAMGSRAQTQGQEQPATTVFDADE